MKRRRSRQAMFVLAAALILAAAFSENALAARLSRKTIAQRVNGLLAQGENERESWGI